MNDEEIRHKAMIEILRRNRHIISNIGYDEFHLDTIDEAIRLARQDEKRRVICRITRLIEGIEKDRWWHIDQNYEKPSEAVLAALKCLKKSIGGERGE